MSFSTTDSSQCQTEKKSQSLSLTAERSLTTAVRLEVQGAASTHLIRVSVRRWFDFMVSGGDGGKDTDRTTSTSEYLFLK